jgi:hypothetical protein
MVVLAVVWEPSSENNPSPFITKPWKHRILMMMGPRTSRPSYWHGHQRAAEQFEDSHKGEITGGSEGGHVFARQRIRWRRWRGAKEKQQGEGDEGETEQAADDVGCEFPGKQWVDRFAIGAE